MKPDDYYFPLYDFHEFEGCRKRYIKADRDFEQQEGFPKIRFAEEIFTPGLPVLRHSEFNQYLYLNPNPTQATHPLHQK
ncbi:uncharacterized protein EAF02_003866 [Botrytis sinoallii]|uniref:uncharacterized protein n=1 Tax=Botrytis sinoallii TaxID=1463999 RepID=UPI0018FF66D1|nr:uncharacterized protein EAF02_003866 [Botrytis sinoallii]KAF7887219.1 hypothetical protein EAF02_003866 [Botrytis sinoallii]